MRRNFPESGLESLLPGSRWLRVGRAFFTNSAIFPLFDLIRVVSTKGLVAYLADLPHHIIFATAIVQAYVIGTWHLRGWRRLVGNLVGPLLYTLVDVLLEGWAFFQAPYHWVYWGFGLLMGMTDVLCDADQSRWHQGWTVLQSLVRTLLFPTVYYLSEIGVESNTTFSWAGWRAYMAAPGHQFILAAAVFLGLLLGVAEAQADRYARLLQRTARQLKQYADWGFGADLIEEAFRNPYKLTLKRVSRTILFMDIRGFTAWTEQQSPDAVAEMLEHFYRASEEVINQFKGQPPSYLGDGVLTRFDDPDAAVQAARTLRETANAALQPWGLAVGIGLHMGEVVEGLLGGKDTRRFDAIGDVVNAASRLGGVAGPGEIIISSTVLQQLHQVPQVQDSRSVTVKGKRKPLTVYSLS